MKILAALLLAVVSFAAAAQAYPARPLRMVVPFAPGGSALMPQPAITQRALRAEAARWRELAAMAGVKDE